MREGIGPPELAPTPTGMIGRKPGQTNRFASHGDQILKIRFWRSMDSRKITISWPVMWAGPIMAGGAGLTLIGAWDKERHEEPMAHLMITAAIGARLKYYADRLGVKLPQHNLVSSRPCLFCGGVMHYHRTCMTWLTRRYVRRCTKCGYTDPY